MDTDYVVDIKAKTCEAVRYIQTRWQDVKNAKLTRWPRVATDPEEAASVVIFR